MPTTIKKISSKITSSPGIFAFACAYLILAFAGFNIFTTGTSVVTYYSHLIKAWGLLIVFASLINYKQYRLDWRTVLSILFIIIFAISCWISKEYGGLTNNLKGILWVLPEMIVLFIIVRNKNDHKWISKFLIILIGISSINAIISLAFAIVGYLYVPPLIGNNFYWCGMAMGRLYGFYTDPNYGGNIAIITIFALLYLYINKKNKCKLIAVVLLILIQFCYISLTGSRTTVVSLFVSLFIFLLIFMIYKGKRKKKNCWQILKIIITPIVSCVICFICITGISMTYEKIEPHILKSLGGPLSDPAQLFPRQFANEVSKQCGIAQITDEDIKYTKIETEENKTFVNSDHIGLLGRDESSDLSNNRIDLWKNAIEIWKTSPIIGVGHNNILNYSEAHFPNGKMSKMNQTTSHNLIFDILAGHGMLGLLCFISILILSIIGAIKTLIKLENENFYKYTIICAILISIFISSMFYPEILYGNTIGSVVFWYLLGHLRTCENYTIGIKSIVNNEK